MTKAGLWLNVSIGVLGIVAFTAASAVMGYKWLAADEADRAYACGSGSRGGLCTSGETTNMVLTFVFGALAVGFALLLIWACAPSDARRVNQTRRARLSHTPCGGCDAAHALNQETPGHRRRGAKI